LWRQDMPHSIVLAKRIAVPYDMHTHRQTPRFSFILWTFFRKEMGHSAWKTQAQLYTA
jgi:hypothetical protein